MLTRYSERRIRRLVNLFIGLEDTPYIYPQTLTFWPAEFNPNRAKRLLDALLSNLHKCFDMASIHVRHYHKTGAIHYHALFAFWDAVPFPPSRMKAEFGTRVFNAWNKLQSERLVRCANRMTEHESSRDALRYLLRRVRIATEPTKPQRWWTYRNARLLHEKTKPLSPAERSQAFKHVMPWRPYKIRCSAKHVSQKPLPPEYESPFESTPGAGWNREASWRDGRVSETVVSYNPFGIDESPFDDLSHFAANSEHI